MVVLRGRYETQQGVRNCQTKSPLLVLNPAAPRDRFAAGDDLARARFLKAPVCRVRKDQTPLARGLQHEGPERIDERLLCALPALAARAPASASVATWAMNGAGGDTVQVMPALDAVVLATSANLQAAGVDA